MINALVKTVKRVSVNVGAGSADAAIIRSSTLFTTRHAVKSPYT